MRAVHFPGGFDGDPRSYISLLKRALRDHGVQAQAADRLTPRWAVRVSGVDIVHLHWLELIVSRDERAVTGLVRSLARVARFLLALVIVRCRGVSIVWTVHNLEPHEQTRPWLDRALAGAVAFLANRVIVHSGYASSRVASRYSRCGRIAVIPHGNYIGVYPDEGKTQLDLRRERGIPDDAFVFLAFGQIRPYKRLSDIAAAIASLDDDAVRLVIAGAPTVASEAARLHAAARDGRVLLDLNRVPDADVVALHRLADAAVIAYRDVFSSGALLLALSHGLPVVAPSEGSAAELVPAPAIESFGAGDLVDALGRMLRGDRSARSGAALRTAASFPWGGVAVATRKVYSDALSNRCR